MRVGLTGGIGSGKSEVGKIFAGLGALVIDADALARGRRLELDLGRVEVMARVTLNGHRLATLWKPPYRQ